MNARLMLRIAATAIAVSFLATGCLIFIDDEVWDAWNADLKIVAEWDEDYKDVDLHVSYPDPANGDTTNNFGTPEFNDLYFEDVSGTAGNVGFFIGDGLNYREIVSPSRRQSTATYSGAAAVEMTEEAKSGGPEIVVVRRPPFDSTNPTWTNSNNPLGLSTSYESFAWIGVGEVYVHGDSGKLVSSGGYSANVSVTIYNNDGDEIARLALPEDMDLTSMSVARIHYFIARDLSGSEYNYYVIAPDVRTMPNGISDFRSLSGAAVYGDGAIGVVGSARE